MISECWRRTNKCEIGYHEVMSTAQCFLYDLFQPLPSICSYILDKNIIEPFDKTFIPLLTNQAASDTTSLPPPHSDDVSALIRASVPGRHRAADQHGDGAARAQAAAVRPHPPLPRTARLRGHPHDQKGVSAA